MTLGNVTEKKRFSGRNRTCVPRVIKPASIRFLHFEIIETVQTHNQKIRLEEDSRSNMSQLDGGAHNF